MKCAVIFYHKNILNIYKKRWIDKCIDSIANQTYSDFDVVELNYGFVQGGDRGELVNIPGKNKDFIRANFENHIIAMNFLLDDLFINKGYDVVFNTNMDDFFDTSRFEKQLKAISEGYDLVSSDFCYIEDRNDNDVVTHHLNICQHGDIKDNLQRKHNVIAHPCVAFSKTFWTDDLKYKNLLGWEDLELWMRASASGKKFHIINEELLHYRIHTNQVTQQHKLV